MELYKNNYDNKSYSDRVCALSSDIKILIMRLGGEKHDRSTFFLFDIRIFKTESVSTLLCGTSIIH